MAEQFRTSAREIERRDFIKLGAGLGAMALADYAVAAPQRANPPQGSIDLHSHWVPDGYAAAIRALGRPVTSLHNPIEQDSNLEQRLKWMDDHGIRAHVLTLDGGMPWAWAERADAVRLAQLVNDAGAAAHELYPQRFLAGIELPIRFPDAALSELNRMAGRPGMRAVHLPNSLGNSDYLFSGAYEAIWSRCEQLGYPVLFHPVDGAENIYGGGSRLGGEPDLAANLNNTLGFAFESATTAAKMILTGVLDRYPDLQVVLPHSGGCFPYVAGRIERGLAAKKFPLKLPFRDYVRRFHYDSITYYPETLEFLVKLVGADRVVIGSDGYAPMDVTEPNALTERLQVGNEDRERILFGNAARLLRL